MKTHRSNGDPILPVRPLSTEKFWKIVDRHDHADRIVEVCRSANGDYRDRIYWKGTGIIDEDTEYANGVTYSKCIRAGGWQD